MIKIDGFPTVEEAARAAADSSAGYTASSAPDTDSILWESGNIGANLSSSPVIAGGKVYVYCCPSGDGFSADSSSIACLDEATGALLWQTTVDTSFSTNPGVVLPAATPPAPLTPASRQAPDRAFVGRDSSDTCRIRESGYNPRTKKAC